MKLKRSDKSIEMTDICKVCGMKGSVQEKGEDEVKVTRLIIVTEVCHHGHQFSRERRKNMRHN